MMVMTAKVDIKKILLALTAVAALILSLILLLGVGMRLHRLGNLEVHPWLQSTEVEDILSVILNFRL